MCIRCAADVLDPSNRGMHEQKAKAPAERGNLSELGHSPGQPVSELTARKRLPEFMVVKFDSHRPFRWRRPGAFVTSAHHG